MKAITCPTILVRCSTRSDGSLSLGFSTPELRPDEKVAFMELQGKNLTLLLQPLDDVPAGLKEVRGRFDTKTPSQRLRAVIYIKFKQTGASGEFEDFYRRFINDHIEAIKATLEPEHQ